MEKNKGSNSIRDLMLSGIAFTMKDCDKKLLNRLIDSNRVDKYYYYTYNKLEKELGMKPEAYFDRISNLIFDDLDGCIEPHDKIYLINQVARYVTVARLYKHIANTRKEPQEEEE